MFIIIHWKKFQDVEIVRKEDGSPRLFLRRKDAEQYAEEHIAGAWLAIYLFAGSEAREKEVRFNDRVERTGVDHQSHGRGTPSAQALG